MSTILSISSTSADFIPPIPPSQPLIRVSPSQFTTPARSTLIGDTLLHHPIRADHSPESSLTDFTSSSERSYLSPPISSSPSTSHASSTRLSCDRSDVDPVLYIFHDVFEMAPREESSSSPSLYPARCSCYPRAAESRTIPHSSFLLAPSGVSAQPSDLPQFIPHGRTAEPIRAPHSTQHGLFLQERAVVMEEIPDHIWDIKNSGRNKRDKQLLLLKFATIAAILENDPSIAEQKKALLEFAACISRLA